MPGKGLPGLGVLNEHVSVLRHKSLAGSPGRNHPVHAKMIVSGIPVGYIDIL